jgi:hypothetical protein
MNYGAFTNDSLTTMYEVVRGALDADDTLKARGEEIRFRVRETAEWKKHAADLGACPNSRCSILGESDSTLGYEQVFSPLEYRSDAASAAECAGLRSKRPCLAVYR